MIDFNHNENDPTGPRKSKFWRLRQSARRQPQPWGWPLHRLGDSEPHVKETHLADGRHGLILGYDVWPDDYEMSVPVHAAQDGEVMFAGETMGGFAISLDHKAHGWATYYAQLSTISVAPNYYHRDRKRQRVFAGDVIGYVTKAPFELRFAVWQWTERGFVAVEPLAAMAELVPAVDIAKRAA